MKVGILGAMLEEVDAIKALMSIQKEMEIAGRVYFEGLIGTTEVVLTFSRWGKVAAATTVTTLIHRFNVDLILFTGVAGAVDSNLNVGDIVVGDGHYQHDMDTRPIFKKYEVPLTDQILFEPNSDQVSSVMSAAERFIQHIQIDPALLTRFSIVEPKVYRGIIATGDQFVSNSGSHENLTYEQAGRKTLAVEMEGGAIAQVCHEHHMPYVIIRTISDKADHSAVIDFQQFVGDIASQYAADIVRIYLQDLASLNS